MTPEASKKWLEEKMIPYYPLGDYKVHPAVAQIKI
jgi:2-oxoglutarate ferredoxin oxidoreductase subunit beta